MVNRDYLERSRSTLIAGGNINTRRKRISESVEYTVLCSAAPCNRQDRSDRRPVFGINDIHCICLAGNLENYINPYIAMRIGMIHTVDVEKIKSPKNAATIDASMALLLDP